MSWLEALNFLSKPPDPRPAREIEGDILDELRFHLDMKARDLEAAGLSPAQARETAQEKFGDFDHIFQRCRRARLGERVMLQRFMAIALFVLIGAVVFLGMQMSRISGQLAAIAAPPAGQQVAPAVAVPIKPVFEDIAGQVINEDLEPIVDAGVFVILKTWPEGRFRQNSFFAKTDAEGKFRFVGAFPKSERNAVNITVIAEGYAFQSRYFDGVVPAKTYKPCVFQMEKASKLEVVVEDQDGKPFEGVTVVPMERQQTGEFPQLLYMQGSEPAWRRSGKDGKIPLPVFSTGDHGKISIDFGDGHGWKEIELQVPHDAAQLTIKGVRLYGLK